MKKIVIAMIAAVAFAGTALAADDIILPAKNGNVTFPHKLHQEKLKGCKDCHEKGPGKIEGFTGMSAGHKLCKNCHEAKKAGPIKCGECHKK